MIHRITSSFCVILLTLSSMIYCDKVKQGDLSKSKQHSLNPVKQDVKEKSSSKKKMKKTSRKSRKKRDFPQKRALANLYLQNNFLAKKVQGKQVIPKIIHQIWVGPHTPPAIFKASQESIKQHLPDWEYKLWTDADIPGLQLHNQKYYDLSKNYGEKADILRYELLYKFGGIYLDVDVVCLKPLDILLQYDVWTCGEGHPEDHINNAVIGASRHHPLLWDCIQSLGDKWHEFENKNPSDDWLEDVSVVNRTGPALFGKSFMKFVNNGTPNIISFPNKYFYPILLSKIRRELKEHNQTFNSQIQALIGPDAFTVHYWTGSWCNSAKCRD